MTVCTLAYYWYLVFHMCFVYPTNDGVYYLLDLTGVL